MVVIVVGSSGKGVYKLINYCDKFHVVLKSAELTSFYAWINRTCLYICFVSNMIDEHVALHLFFSFIIDFEQLFKA